MENIIRAVYSPASPTGRFYDYFLNKGGNIFFTVIFGLMTVYFIGMVIKSRYWWFNITFIAGFAVEFVGYLARCLSFNDQDALNYFLIQTICLMVAPAIIMAGIYFLTAQLIVIHGRQFSFLKPMWYSAIFITVDIISFLMQAAGGGLFNNVEKRTTGKNVMLIGIIVQVVGMTFYLILLIDFLRKIYFKNTIPSQYAKPGVVNFFKLLFNVPSIRSYRLNELDLAYNPNFADLRQPNIFNYFPYALFVAVIYIYIRSIFRLVELAQGLDGYLFSKEAFLFGLDGTLIALAGVVFHLFHPVWIYGKEVRINSKTIKQNQDEVEQRDDINEEMYFDGLSQRMEKI